MKKRCFKCGIKKEQSEFYRHRQMADGYLGKCKECAKKDAIEHRLKNIDRIREHDRQRGKLPYRIRENNRRRKIGRKRFPLQYAAQTLFGNAIRDKKVKKGEKCKRCGIGGKLHGHHEDYYKPLDVIWLCPVCHNARHKEMKKI